MSFSSELYKNWFANQEAIIEIVVNNNMVTKGHLGFLGLQNKLELKDLLFTCGKPNYLEQP